MQWVTEYVISILIASFQQNLTFKIQMLAGNSLKIHVSSSSQISLTLVTLRFATLPKRAQVKFRLSAGTWKCRRHCETLKNHLMCQNFGKKIIIFFKNQFMNSINKIIFSMEIRSPLVFIDFRYSKSVNFGKMFIHMFVFVLKFHISKYAWH